MMTSFISPNNNFDSEKFQNVHNMNLTFHYFDYQIEYFELYSCFSIVFSFDLDMNYKDFFM